MGESIKGDLVELDEAIYGAIAGANTPSLDRDLAALSRFADFSMLWIACALALWGLAGKPGRRAASAGLLSIGLTSGAVNLFAKRAWSRSRPDRSGYRVPRERHVPMPSSTSFPSGHSASAFAFAAAAGSQIPLISPPLTALAAGVAYSRVHTGVHYPGDVIVGSTIGWTLGHLVGGIFTRLKTR